MTIAAEVPNHIGGLWSKSEAREFIDVINPATGEIMARTPLLTAPRSMPPSSAATAAFPAWRRTPVGERIQYLFKLRRCSSSTSTNWLGSSRRKRKDAGRGPRRTAARGIENVEVACGMPVLMQGYNLEDVTAGVDEMLIRQPLGVVAAITPFNFPAMIPFWFLALRDRLRQYAHPQAVGARAVDDAPRWSS